MKQVILITGTPCVGKTTLARRLAQRLEAVYVNLTDYAKQNSLTCGYDLKRDTVIVDEVKMRQALTVTINESVCSSVIVDGHFAASVVPDGLPTHVFVLRRNPVELKEYMQREGFSEAKMFENLSAEILDVCLVEALQTQTGKVCELDATGKTVEQLVEQVFSVLLGEQACVCGGVVDWLEFLEREGLTDKYLFNVNSLS
ncbi:MAG: adenylate kinase family protein [Candidatus Bathyarchaeota archaeon]|uniref:adenylate kinase family protein n=1 Tax=Candidatus Bathycorpusculum sp. TaxID=2994959 RepID=UPI00281F4718|nr:adenylate kinase family protein [Candidatus Termiticorpusculum sp.]MCL2256767.1 adenylate kinase family protein [Candidatus Termiticorpusculum sp.]MCL2293166.1 adenylate kinase family protein [Candidatus Termiticorpusculum sp.]